MKKIKRIQKQKTNWKLLIICLVSVYLVAFLGSIFTSNNTKSVWYESVKPSITPPSIVFPIVWNILFFLIALSFYFALISAKDPKTKRKVLGVFIANFILNILWSVLYFGLKNPLAAFIEIIFLILSIALMIAVTWKISKKSAYLLVPYFLWVCFASVLNYLSIITLRNLSIK